MRLRKLALTNPAAAFLIPFFEARSRWPRSTSGDERLDADTRRRLADAPSGAAQVLGDLVDSTPRWRLAADDEIALAIRILGALQASEGLPAVMRAACEISVEDDDTPVGRALYHAVKDYAPVAMASMVSYVLDRGERLGLLPSYMLAEPPDERAINLALVYLKPDIALELHANAWHARLIATLGWCESSRCVPALATCLDAMPRRGGEAWARSVASLATAIERLGGRLTGDQQQVAELADAMDFRTQERLREETAECYRLETEASQGSTTRARLAELACHPATMVRAAVAGNAHTPPSTLAMLAGDPSPEVRCAVATNEHTPEPAQCTLARDLEIDVRRALARCRDVYPSVTGILFRDADSDVRAQAVDLLPPQLLCEAARDPDPDVREAVAQNPHATSDILELLASDAEASVRAAVASTRASAAHDARIAPSPSAI